MQGKLQHLHEVEVAGEDVGLLAEGAHLDAAAAAAGARIDEGLALAQLFLDHRVRVEDGGEAVAVTHHLQGVLQEDVRGFARELDVTRGLQEVHLVDHVEDEVGDLVGAVGAVGKEPAEVYVGEIGIGAALRGGHAYLRRGRMVVELDEEALHELARAFFGEGAAFQTLPVEGIKVLVQVPRAEGVPAVQLGDDGQVAEPVGLQGLPVVGRRVRGHPAAVGRDL